MKTLSFFGLIASAGLFILTWLLMNQNCYNWSCDCPFQLSNQIKYSLLSLGFSVFYLFYSLFFLFRISETKIKITRESKHKLLDDTFVEQECSIYEHAPIKKLVIIGVVMSTGLLIFAFFCNNIGCTVKFTCNAGSCPSNFSYDQEIYTIGYGVIGVYLMVLTLIGLFKSHPSKY
jgi:hypothetical protein